MYTRDLVSIPIMGSGSFVTCYLGNAGMLLFKVMLLGNRLYPLCWVVLHTGVIAGDKFVKHPPSR